MWFLRKKKDEEVVHIPLERRKFNRIKNILTVICKRQNSSEDFKIFTDNISEGGIRGVTQEPVSKDEIIYMNILLHSIHTCVSAVGRIVWVNYLGKQQFDLGVEFTKIEENDRLKFKEYIDRFRMNVVHRGI